MEVQFEGRIRIDPDGTRWRRLEFAGFWTRVDDASGAEDSSMTIEEEPMEGLQRQIRAVDLWYRADDIMNALGGKPPMERPRVTTAAGLWQMADDIMAQVEGVMFDDNSNSQDLGLE